MKEMGKKPVIISYSINTDVFASALEIQKTWLE